MTFFQAYKRLDNLCKDLLESDKGVTAYIEEMKQCTTYENRVNGWKEDYNSLVHYRHMRNKIAHEVDFCEEDYCTLKDIEWLEGFYQRILKCTDPLALYEKAKAENAVRIKKHDFIEMFPRENTRKRRGMFSLIRKIFGL